jgi:hypothetical protein
MSGTEIVGACYAAALPIALWGLWDLGRVPGRVFFYLGDNSRPLWIGAIVLGFAAFGIPGALATVAWRWSASRARVREELRWARAASRQPSQSAGERAIDLTRDDRRGGSHERGRSGDQDVLQVPGV